jgi:peptidoglycan/LPS O-acetylase OafA/YrhL
LTILAALPAARDKTETSPYHSDGLLELRGLAALSVVCSHAALGSYLASATGIDSLGALAISGSYAVFIFFALSGYLMAKILDRSYGPGHIGEFYRNRAARILPLYYVAVAASLVLTTTPLRPDHWPVLLLAYDYDFPGTFPNAALWSLSTECQFYLLAPVIAVVSRRWSATPLVLLVASMLIRFAYCLTLARPDLAYTSLETNLLYFMAGWVAYAWRVRLPAIPRQLGLIVVVSALLCVWAYHFAFIENTQAGLYASTAWKVVFPLLFAALCLLVLPGLDAKAPSQDAGTRLLFPLGIASFSVYVLHLPIIAAAPLAAPLQVALAYVAAGAIYIGIERPLFRLRTRVT